MNKDSDNNDKTLTRKTEKMTKNKRGTSERKTKNRDRNIEKTLTQDMSVRSTNSERILEEKTKGKEKTVKSNDNCKRKEGV